MREEVTCTEELNEKEKARYDENMKTLMNKYHKMKNWRKLLGIHCRYKKPFLANAEALIMGREDVNIAKMDEELAPSDSESDFGSASESNSVASQQDGDDITHEEEDSMVSLNLDLNDQNMQSSIASPGLKSQQTFNRRHGSISLTQQRRALHILKVKTKMNKQLYVMPCFLKPGKQTFVVQSQMYETDI